MESDNKHRFTDLSHQELKDNPFSVPDNYFSSLEENVREKVHHSEKIYPRFQQIKSYLTLAVSFLVVLGIGYGVLSLTPILQRSSLNIENDEFTALINDGYINERFVDYLYDEISIKETLDTTNIFISDSFSEVIENELSENELIDYLNSYTYNDK
jgi:hypothetical protein